MKKPIVIVFLGSFVAIFLVGILGWKWHIHSVRTRAAKHFREDLGPMVKSFRENIVENRAYEKGTFEMMKVLDSAPAAIDNLRKEYRNTPIEEDIEPICQDVVQVFRDVNIIATGEAVRRTAAMAPVLTKDELDFTYSQKIKALDLIEKQMAVL